MHWLEAVTRLRGQRQPGVLVTLTSVAGHAPREAGAKMVVGRSASWGSIGGGNLEETARRRARDVLAALDAGARPDPQALTLGLTDHGTNLHGRQCCGGRVEVLLEPIPVVPAVAVVGLGHVGLELARILARHDVELHLVDSRAAALEPGRLAVLDDAVARVHRHHAPVPELALGQVPTGTHVLIMTHDHAEDLALCDTALRSAHLGPVGLIGSAAKWSRFRRALVAEGHAPEAISAIRCPIGLVQVPGKEPAAIAVAVAAQLLAAFDGASPAPASSSAPSSVSSSAHGSWGAFDDGRGS